MEIMEININYNTNIRNTTINKNLTTTNIYFKLEQGNKLGSQCLCKMVSQNVCHYFTMVYVKVLRRMKFEILNYLCKLIVDAVYVKFNKMLLGTNCEKCRIIYKNSI